MLIPLLFALCLIDSPAVMKPDYHDPADYTSPSGEHRLHVVSLSRQGTGAADYEMFSGGSLVWSQRLPFAFHDAAVSNDGVVAGFAHFADFRRLIIAPDAALVMAIIDSKGKLVLEERSPYYYTGQMGISHHPRAFGMVADFDHDRYYLNVVDQKNAPPGATTWAYSIDQLKRIGAFSVPTDLASMDEERLRSLFSQDWFVVPDTGLVLHRLTSYASRDRGASFALVDPEGSIKWSLHWPTDYNFEDADRNTARLRSQVDEMGIVRGTGKPAQFELRQLETQEIITFQVRPDRRKDGEWLVEEIARRPDGPPLLPAEQSPSTSPVEIQLELVSTVQLEHVPTDPNSPFGDLDLLEDALDWAITGDGSCVILRADEGRDLTQIRISKDGDFVDQIAITSLPATFDGYFDQVHWVGQDRWLVSTALWSHGEHQPLAMIDAQTGAVRSLPALVAADLDGVAFLVESAVGLSNGDLLGIGGYLTSDTHALVCWSPQGEVRWITQQEPGFLTSPQGLAVASDGQIAVLDDGHMLVMFSATGDFMSTVDLEESTGEHLGNRLKIQADQNGHILVLDYSLLYRITTGGKLLDVLSPRYLGQDDYQIYLAENAQCFGDGTIWTSDNRSLLRLAENGLVEEVTGVPRAAGTVQGYVEAAILPGGRICIWDGGTGQMNVWNEAGQRQWVGDPQLGPAFDYEPRDLYPLQTRGEEVWIQVNDPFDYGGISFNMGWDQAGQPVGVLAVKGSIAFVPDSWRYWTWTRDGGAVLHAEDGAQLAHVERLPNGRWLRDLRHITFGPQGEVYLQEKLGFTYSRDLGYLVICSPDGNVLSAEWQQFDLRDRYGTPEPGRWKVVGNRNQLYRAAHNGQAPQWLEATSPIMNWPNVHGISSDGLHLLSLDTKTMTLFKSALPK